MKQKNVKVEKLHLICNAHIDPVWQWQWEEGIAATLSTFQSVVNLLNKYDFIFCHNEVILYEYIEKYSPRLFEEIKELVRKGKWRIMGGWYLQPDCIMPGGEFLIRQIRTGEAYFKEKFGVFPTTAIGFDSFGHNRGIVQIMQKCGQDGYLFVRPYSERCGNQLDLPEECFIWEGYDGSKVKAFRVPLYSSVLGGVKEKLDLDFKWFEKSGTSLAATGWGVGNHGGGPSEKDIQDVAKMMEESDTEIIHSYPEKFFEEANPTKVFSKSLITSMIGCYTAMGQVKRKYRELERLYTFCEKLSSLASLKGTTEYPKEKLDEAMRDIMEIEFHDILPGSCIKAAEEDALAQIGHGLTILRDIRKKAFFDLCAGQKIAEENTFPILVFEPHAIKRKTLVECELLVLPTELWDEQITECEIYDENGKKLPCQTIKEESSGTVDYRKRIIFECENQPLSINRYNVRTVVVPKKEYQSNKDIVFDNGEKSVHISATTGLIESYKVNGKEYAKSSMFKPYMYDDEYDPWMTRNNSVFEPLGKNPVPFNHEWKPDGIFEGQSAFSVIEDGDIYLGAEAVFKCGETRMRIGYRIYKTGSAIDVDVQIYPGDGGKAVKLHLPTTLKGKYFGAEIFGSEELYNDGRECIARDYVAVADENKCLQVLTPTTFGSSYQDGEIMLTLLRTPIYSASSVLDRKIKQFDRYYNYIDLKEQDYYFRLDVSDKESLQQKADEYNEKPYALNHFPIKDENKDNGFSVYMDNPEITLVTVKKAEQADGFIFRLFNNSEQNKSTALNAGKAKITLDFNKYEVKTVVYNDGVFKEIFEALI